MENSKILEGLDINKVNKYAAQSYARGCEMDMNGVGETMEKVILENLGDTVPESELEDTKNLIHFLLCYWDTSWKDLSNALPLCLDAMPEYFHVSEKEIEAVRNNPEISEGYFNLREFYQYDLLFCIKTLDHLKIFAASQAQIDREHEGYPSPLEEYSFVQEILGPIVMDEDSIY